MEQILEPDERRAVLAALRGAVAVDGGPTAEQQRFLDVLRSRVLGLGEDPEALEPADAANLLGGELARRLAVESVIAVELMRHPPSPELADRVATYLAALEGDGIDVELVRDAVAEARERVADDWARMSEQHPPETSLAGESEADVASRLAHLGDLPEGTLGRSFYDFHIRSGFPVPEAVDSLVPHGFAHVLAGYEATPEGELALQAMLVTSTGGTDHFSGLVASLLLFEVGLMPFPDIEPKVAVLDRPGAADLFAEAFGRGRRRRATSRSWTTCRCSSATSSSSGPSSGSPPRPTDPTPSWCDRRAAMVGPEM